MNTIDVGTKNTKRKSVKPDMGKLKVLEMTGTALSQLTGMAPLDKLRTLRLLRDQLDKEVILLQDMLNNPSNKYREKQNGSS